MVMLHPGFAQWQLTSVFNNSLFFWSWSFALVFLSSLSSNAHWKSFSAMLISNFNSSTLFTPHFIMNSTSPGNLAMCAFRTLLIRYKQLSTIIALKVSLLQGRIKDSWSVWTTFLVLSPVDALFPAWWMNAINIMNIDRNDGKNCNKQLITPHPHICFEARHERTPRKPIYIIGQLSFCAINKITHTQRSNEFFPFDCLVVEFESLRDT